VTFCLTFQATTLPLPLCSPISTQGHRIHPRIGRGLCYVYPLIAKEDSELIPNKRLYHLFALLSNKNEAISWAHSIILSVPRLHVIPSPCPDVVITPFDEARHPAFKEIFKSQPGDSRLRHFALDPSEIPLSLVLENRSEKAINGLSYRWRKLDGAGKIHNHTASSDSYFLDVFRAIAEPGSSHLIGPSGSLDDAMLDHVQAGGGFISGIRGGTKGPQPDVVEVTFEIDLVVFADGEIAGPDPDRLAALLQCRKRAAEFVARQVRLADAEKRDAITVISALAQFPHLGRPGHGQYDPLAHLNGICPGIPGPRTTQNRRSRYARSGASPPGEPA
jgi:hypothetical protein